MVWTWRGLVAGRLAVRLRADFERVALALVEPVRVRLAVVAFAATGLRGVLARDFEPLGEVVLAVGI
ncbi:MAG TPA: hypothetical protein VKG62_08085 [Solirubrobacteraceae bacterium]|nr:hypothetical protein [Solirubrobacteraceae bacterium]